MATGWFDDFPVAWESACADSCVNVASVLQSLGSSLTANAYPAGTNEFSFGERRHGSSGVLTAQNRERRMATGGA